MTTEILSGKRTDKHLAKAIDLLSARGLQLAYADYVGDAPDRITATPHRVGGSKGVSRVVAPAYAALLTGL